MALGGAGARRPGPREVVRAWTEAFNRQDPAALGALYADDAVNHQVPEPPVVGRVAITRMFREAFQAIPDMGFEVVNLIVAGEWAALEWSGWGTHLGPLGSAPPSGRRYALQGCGFFQVRDGKIVRQRGYWDRATLTNQLGLPLLPP